MFSILPELIAAAIVLIAVTIYAALKKLSKRWYN